MKRCHLFLIKFEVGVSSFPFSCLNWHFSSLPLLIILTWICPSSPRLLFGQPWAWQNKLDHSTTYLITWQLTYLNTCHSCWTGAHGAFSMSATGAQLTSAPCRATSPQLPSHYFIVIGNRIGLGGHEAAQSMFIPGLPESQTNSRTRRVEYSAKLRKNFLLLIKA